MSRPILPGFDHGYAAGLQKRHLPATSGLCRPFLLDGVTLNAKGFERLGGRLLGRVADG